MTSLKLVYCFILGPEHWKKLYPLASGSHQSPINIPAKGTVPAVTRTRSKLENNTTEKEQLKQFEPFTLKYCNEACQKITNTGHGWKVEYSGNGCELHGGPLKEKFTLAQFHCHWGTNENNGSEHTIDGKGYAGEVNFKYLKF